MHFKTLLLALFMLTLASPAMTLTPHHEEPRAAFFLHSSWGSDHYCGEIRVTSPYRELTDWWIEANISGTISNFWNGSYELVEDQSHNVEFAPAEWNATVPVGGRTTIGLCGRGEPPHGIEVGVVTDTPDSQQLEIIDLASSEYAGNNISKQYVVANSQAEVESIEAMIGRQLDVNIDDYTVIAAFMGMQPTGGYSIKVTEAFNTGTQVQLVVRLASPGSGCFVTQATTSPYHVVAIEKTSLPVEVEEVKAVFVCN